MGRKRKPKDIAEYLWHCTPVQINATNDNWRIRYGYLDSNNQEHQTTETLKTKRAKDQFLSFLVLHEKKHRHTKKSINVSVTDTDKIETVEQLMLAYIDHAKYLHTIGDRYGWDEGTLKANIGKIKNYIFPIFGSYRIWEITRVDLRQGFKNMLQLPRARGNHKDTEQKVSQRAVYDCKKILSRAFKYATDELEILEENPMIGVTVKQPKSTRRNVWTEEQFIFAYNNCSNPLLKLLMSLMIVLSTRVSECLALTWNDVIDNLDDNEPSYIRVYKELVYRSIDFIEETNRYGIIKVFDQVPSTRPNAKRRAVFHITKTEKEISAKTDRIYVSQEIIVMLRNYKKIQNQQKIIHKTDYIDDNLIFAHPDGRFINAQYADTMFRKLYKSLELPRVDLYSLRHFSITKKLALNGHDYVSLAKDTAHHQISTIQEYYETPEDSVRIDTANALGKFLVESTSNTVNTAIEDDFYKRLHTVAADSSGKQMLELTLAMFEQHKSN